MPTQDPSPVIGATDPSDGSKKPIKGYWASLLGLYLIAMSITLSYMLYNLWPPQPKGKGVTTGQTSEQTTSVRKAAKNDNTNASGSGNTNSSTVQPNANASGTTSNSNSGSLGNPAGSVNSNSAGVSAGRSDSTSAENTIKDPTQNDTRTAAEEMLPTVSLFRGWLVMSHSVEVRLLLIALLAGALGSYIHAATSFADYVGNQKLSGNWVWWYLLRPFIGMSLALVFYFVVRGGFISPNAGGADMNPFGIAAMAGLVGMFSKNAIDKLDEVFTSLFGSKGDEKRGDKLQAPTITSIRPNTGPIAGGTAVTVTGNGFLPGLRVTFGGNSASGIVIGPDGKTIGASTPPGKTAEPVDVEVINANGQKAVMPGGFKYQ